MPPAIRIANLSKRYRLGQHVQGDRTLRDALVHTAKRLLGQAPAAEKQQAKDNTFWALDDVSLDIAPGEVVGIVGHNGAGKSTLLKVLAGITSPTQGRVEIRGRVASLLEVGTGFHPELSGRENIYLNGSILGMTRPEIRAKFDDIVAFAGVERFLDTPVKRYSSGMRVRLAFAVAAHLDPEILIVDEVLAVGDAAFQTKCLGKMQELADGGGRTVLFVSHNMSSVRNLCTRAIYLEKGCVLADGTPDEIITQYRTGLEASKTKPLAQQHGLGERPPVTEGRESQGNDCDTLKDRSQGPHVIGRLQHHAKWRIVLGMLQRVGQRQKLRPTFAFGLAPGIVPDDPVLRPNHSHENSPCLVSGPCLRPLRLRCCKAQP